MRTRAVTKEGINATLLQHVSPIEWDNVILYGQSTSSIAPGSAKERVLMLYFNTNVGATLMGKRECCGLKGIEMVLSARIRLM